MFNEPIDLSIENFEQNKNHLRHQRDPEGIPIQVV